MQSSLQTSAGFPVPLLGPPLADPFGCWDPSAQATALLPDSLDEPSLQAWLDPVLASPAGYQLSVGCGSVLSPAPASAAELPSDSCPEPGGVAVGTSGPLSLDVVGPFVSFTCAEVQESLVQRALWQAAFKIDFNQKLVFIESATLYVGAPSAPAVSPIGAALLAGLMLGAGCWMVRRRPPAHRR
jgi:hypothetical protein